jgi:AcrR family transcriptional regulator
MTRPIKHGPARIRRRRSEVRQPEYRDLPRLPGRPAGMSGDRTRERVVGAALETFAEQGFAGSSVRDIARKARIRVSSLYHYFPSKEALYEAVLAKLQDEVRTLTFGVISQSPDLRAMGRESVGKIFDFLLANPAYVKLGFHDRLDGVPLFDRRVTDRWLGLMDGLMKPAELQGLVKAVDPAFLLVTIDGLVHWHIANDPFYRRVLGKGFDDPDLVRRAREHVIQVVMRTLGLE